MEVTSDLISNRLKQLDMSTSKSSDGIQTYTLGDWKLQSGQTIPNAHIAYKTFGDRKSPAIIYPSWYSGSTSCPAPAWNILFVHGRPSLPAANKSLAIADNEWLIGEDKALSPSKYYIIITALFGNGQSSSPSNTPSLRPFPNVTFYDNVRAQHTLVTQYLGIMHARAVLGWSMGAGQTYQWATQYPDFMDIAIPFCGSAKTSLHNQVFLEGVKAALLAGKGHSSAGVCANGKGREGEAVRTWSDEEREVGLKALGRVYAGWGFSQAFYRERLYETVLGFKDLEDFMVNFWEKWALSKGSLSLYYRFHDHC